MSDASLVYGQETSRIAIGRDVQVGGASLGGFPTNTHTYKPPYEHKSIAKIKSFNEFEHATS